MSRFEVLMSTEDEAPSSPLSDPQSDISAIFTPSKSALQYERSILQSRPSRKRTAPQNFDSGLGETPRKRSAIPKTNGNLELTRTSSSPTPMGLQRKQPLRGNWSVNHLLTNPKSKLATVNLTDLLNNDRAWTELSREQQEQLISMLPGACAPSMPEGEQLPNVPKECLRSNRAFQADVRIFQEDLKEGRYDPKWLADAQKAMEKRANGDFDAWKEKNKEEFWGQKQKIDWHARAGDSSQHDLKTLVKAGCFQLGDVWCLKRGHGRGGAAVVVEKEATITAIFDDHLLTFRFAPGQHKLQTHDEASNEDVMVDKVDGPIMLSNAILKEDGRIVGVRGPNSWKEFRCMRRNQDMGSLWDIRELFHSRLER